MNSRLTRTVALIAGIHVLGGHWFALQTVAWMGMLATHSQTEAFGEALEKTFDGKHPCPLCCAVESGRKKEKEEQEKQLVDPVNTVKAMPQPAFSLPSRSGIAVIYFESPTSADPLAILPPTPPPRQV